MGRLNAKPKTESRRNFCDAERRDTADFEEWWIDELPYFGNALSPCRSVGDVIVITVIVQTRSSRRVHGQCAARPAHPDLQDPEDTTEFQGSVSTQHSPAVSHLTSKAVVTTTIGLRFDGRSTVIRHRIAVESKSNDRIVKYSVYYGPLFSNHNTRVILTAIFQINLQASRLSLEIRGFGFSLPFNSVFKLIYAILLGRKSTLTQGAW